MSHPCPTDDTCSTGSVRVYHEPWSRTVQHREVLVRPKLVETAAYNIPSVFQADGCSAQCCRLLPHHFPQLFSSHVQHAPPGGAKSQVGLVMPEQQLTDFCLQLHARCNERSVLLSVRRLVPTTMIVSKVQKGSKRIKKDRKGSKRINKDQKGTRKASSQGHSSESVSWEEASSAISLLSLYLQGYVTSMAAIRLASRHAQSIPKPPSWSHIGNIHHLVRSKSDDQLQTALWNAQGLAMAVLSRRFLWDVPPLARSCWDPHRFSAAPGEGRKLDKAKQSEMNNTTQYNPIWYETRQDMTRQHKYNTLQYNTYNRYQSVATPNDKQSVPTLAAQIETAMKSGPCIALPNPLPELWLDPRQKQLAPALGSFPTSPALAEAQRGWESLAPVPPELLLAFLAFLVVLVVLVQVLQALAQQMAPAQAALRQVAHPQGQQRDPTPWTKCQWSNSGRLKVQSQTGF